MAYKTFANGFPLPASDLNNFLMNQSVIVFADSAARTTAIPSPVEGMLTYLQDTNAYESWNGSAFIDINDNTAAIPKSTVTTSQDLIVADGASSVTRLGVGTDDQVLSVVAGEVAWADAGGGGGKVWTQIFSGTISTGTGTATISGLSGYDNYSIRINGISGTSTFGTIYSFLINGDATGAGSYRKAANYNSNSSSTSASTSMELGQADTPSAALFGNIRITGASGTGLAEVSIVSGMNAASDEEYSAFTNTMANKDSAELTNIGFRVGGGTIDAGSVTVWGA